MIYDIHVGLMKSDPIQSGLEDFMSRALLIIVLCTGSGWTTPDFNPPSPYGIACSSRPPSSPSWCSPQVLRLV